ncbi:hypothetical protein Ahy_A03g014384 [Arachis hypogaea]|uniref:Uncharacterized protein n=1 Tax=Arachis hypogaea TaxID=3818 RepID=A0A445DXT7_ARAHY|nr:hypothetical protein Ahy_A03g014384 [Arachis hypogaea]
MLGESKIGIFVLEGNRGADCLARKGLELEPGLHFWDTPPREIVSILFDDEKGISLSRLICI